MPKLPQVRPEEVIRALQRLGFAEDRQVGSHRIMVKRTSDGRKLSVPVPMHKGKTVRIGTLRSILDLAGVSPDEFLNAL